MKLSVVILAAGKGTRMHSTLPKILHKLAGKAMIDYVVNTAKKLNPRQINMIVGFQADLVKTHLQNEKINFIYQENQLGTGHAISLAQEQFADDEDILILFGDIPLITEQTLRSLIQSKPKDGLALLTAVLDDPTGYGRIIRENDQVKAIVEHKDASYEQLKINEINTGFMVASGKSLKKWLAQLNCDNAQNEFYITDVIALANQDSKPVKALTVKDINEIKGVNTRLQLAELERIYQNRLVNNLMEQGVSILDPKRFDLRGEITFGKDITIDINVILEGSNKLGDNVQIGAGVVLKNCDIGSNVNILPFSVLENVTIGTDCVIGPFARIRPETVIADHSKIGNFVEIKKSNIGQNTKINHLSYVGDSKIGNNVNIGAGVITCNYDGANKHQTQIKDDVFIGSDTQLIAPVIINQGATIAAGSTITKNVAPNELVLSRVTQKHIQNWERPKKQQKK